MADICVPPDCLNGYDCYWLFFCLFISGINTKHSYYFYESHTKHHHDHLHHLLLYTAISCGIYCYTVITVIYLFVSVLYLVQVLLFMEIHFTIWGNGLNWCLLWYILLYIVILLYILLYISYIYSILLQKLCLLPPVYSVTSSCNSVASE